MQKLFSHYRSRFGAAPPFLDAPPARNLRLAVTIPAHREENILSTLESLQACRLPEGDVEILVCVNGGADSDADTRALNSATVEQVNSISDRHSTSQRAYHVFLADDLPPRHAGVGLARKLVMDEAASRFAAGGFDDGIIAGLDADSLVDIDYLRAIERAFRRAPAMPAASIHYEHPLNGADFAPDVYRAIVEYELHLRTYVEGLRAADYPWAFHTIGSSFAVRAAVYCREGGMNKRKAAEDFYFLQKLFPLGDYGEILDTRVIPSPRISDRVPFGTGKAVGDRIESGAGITSYDPRTWRHLRHFCRAVRSLHTLETADFVGYLRRDDLLDDFLRSADFYEALEHLRANSGGAAMLRRKIFTWFNNLRALKFVHRLRDEVYPVLPAEQSAAELFELESLEISHAGPQQNRAIGLLLELRRRQSTPPGWTSKC